MDKILNFEQPLDVHLLDTIVHSFYSSTNAIERKQVETILTQFQDHPDAWLRVKDILEASQKQETKFIALQVLDKCIKYRWKILPAEQREGIKNYIIALIIKLSGTEESLITERIQLQKLNSTIVSVLKQEWPRNWGGFVAEICGASRSSESICENNMHILKLLCEEVFDFSQGEMTQAKIRELKNQFTAEFQQIYQLCDFVLQNSQHARLLSNTLKAMLRFLPWIPEEYIFSTDMINWLVFKFLPVPQFRNDALACLSEIANYKDHDKKYSAALAKMFGIVMGQLAGILTAETNIALAYENGTSEDELFIQQLSLFITNFLKQHLALVEVAEYQNILLQALHYLVGISMVEEIEVFKICLEYWHILATELYNTECQFRPAMPLALGGGQPQASPRRQLYDPILSRVRVVFIDRMPRPEEVLIKEDEAGEIVRETMKDTDAIILYKSMRDALVFLTHLNYEDTEHIMQTKLDEQVNHDKFTWNRLNTLCWAIGSISGAMSEDNEKRFLVTVIKELLSLCEQKRGKDNKAVVASNIMYVVGQYPRFLRAHWKFLKTVVNKLFEFMHETHPGVQDMACETFLKIAQKCRRKFVTTQAGEQQPFIDELLGNLGNTINDLQPHQIHSFYESVGYMISASLDINTKRALIDKLMEVPNRSWHDLTTQAATNLDFLRNNETIKLFSNLLTTNRMCASSAGPCFVFQLGNLYLDMLHIYKAYSEMISSRIASTTSVHITKHFDIGIMRKVKKETLRLIETYVEQSEDPAYVVQNFLPPLLDPVLGDYARGVPDARDAEVLSLMAVLVSKLGIHMSDHIPKIFEALFATTLNMITANFHDYPDIRLNFFRLLEAVTKYNFLAFFSPAMQPQFKLVMDSVSWAYKHTERTIAEIGLQIQLDMLVNVAECEFADAFFKQFYLSVLNDVLYVLTDTFHKPGLKLQSAILMVLLNGIENGVVRVQLWDPSVSQGPNNVQFIKEHIANLLATQFPNLTQLQIKNIIGGMFTYKNSPPEFKNHLRDFLVQLKEFSDADNADLYEEERAAQIEQDKDIELRRRQAVPGLVPVYERQEDMNDGSE